jgi:glycosyltransferase involved in cell wall biosynthesis
MVNALLPGGAEIQLMQLAEGLAGSGHNVTICCIYKALIGVERIEAAGVTIVSLGAKTPLQRIAALPRMIRLARRSEIVHCTIWDASLWGRIAAILARRPVVVADHATDRSIHTSAKGASRQRWVEIHNRLLDPFTYATVACASTQRSLLLSEGVDPEKIVYIPNGLPLAAMVEAASASPEGTALGLPEGRPLVVQVGVFREEKNQIAALEAFAGVRDAGVDADLVFVGDGPEMSSVQARAAELKADWAHFLGYRNDIPAILAHADLLVQPSLADAMPLTVLEAMALGVPVVATDVGDVAAMLDGRAGLCVPANDQAALETALTELLTDPDRRRDLGEAGRELAAPQDSGVMVHSYELLFEGAVEGRTPTTILPQGFDPQSAIAS